MKRRRLPCGRSLENGCLRLGSGRRGHDHFEVRDGWCGFGHRLGSDRFKRGRLPCGRGLENRGLGLRKRLGRRYRFEGRSDGRDHRRRSHFMDRGRLPCRGCLNHRALGLRRKGGGSYMRFENRNDRRGGLGCRRRCDLMEGRWLPCGRRGRLLHRNGIRSRRLGSHGFGRKHRRSGLKDRNHSGSHRRCLGRGCRSGFRKRLERRLHGRCRRRYRRRLGWRNRLGLRLGNCCWRWCGLGGKRGERGSHGRRQRSGLRSRGGGDHCRGRLDPGLRRWGTGRLARSTGPGGCRRTQHPAGVGIEIFGTHVVEHPHAQTGYP